MTTATKVPETEPYDPTVQLWLETRRLERDLDALAHTYGLDCRGVGFAALANALVHRGWTSKTTNLRRKEHERRVVKEVKELLAPHRLRFKSVTGHLHVARRQDPVAGSMTFGELADIKQKALRIGALMRGDDGDWLLTTGQLSTLFEMDTAVFARIRSKEG